MKPLIYLFLISFGLTNCMGQTKKTPITDCNFYKNLSSKKEVDTIVLKGKYVAMIALPELDQLKKLNKEGKIELKDFKSALVFKLENCTYNLYFPTRDHSKEAESLFGGKRNKPIEVTCIVFNKYIYDQSFKGMPFMIVDKIRLR